MLLMMDNNVETCSLHVSRLWQGGFGCWVQDQWSDCGSETDELCSWLAFGQLRLHEWEWKWWGAWRWVCHLLLNTLFQWQPLQLFWKLFSFHIPMILCSCLSAVPIQKAKDLVQENQVLLNTTRPTIQDTAPSTGLKSFSRGTEAHANCQPESFSPYHNQRGRGGRRGGGRREGHRGIPQSRRPTLLEMVRRYLR